MAMMSKGWVARYPRRALCGVCLAFTSNLPGRGREAWSPARGWVMVSQSRGRQPDLAWGSVPVAAYVRVGTRQLGSWRVASHSRTGHRSGCTGFLRCVAIPVDASRIAMPINQAEPLSWMDFVVSGCLDIHFCGAMGVMRVSSMRATLRALRLLCGGLLPVFWRRRPSRYAHGPTRANGL